MSKQLSWIKKFLNSNYGSIIISIILGFGLSCVFRKTCKNEKCVTYKSPPPLNEKKIRWEDECYKYVKLQIKCPEHGEIIFDENN